MRTIVIFALVFAVVAKNIHGQSSDEEKKQICTPGSHTKVECNTCTCSLDGTALGCTRRSCPKKPEESTNSNGAAKLPRQTTKLCEPGSLRKSGCTNCLCSPDGTSESCSNTCSRSVRPRRDDLFSCKPNSTYMDDCNHCICSPDGRSATCTERGCLPNISVQESKPSSVIS